MCYSFIYRMEKKLELKGQLVEIVYRNDSNSYTIAGFEKEDGEILTVVRVSSFY